MANDSSTEVKHPPTVIGHVFQFFVPTLVARLKLFLTLG